MPTLKLSRDKALGYLSGYVCGGALKFSEPMRRALTLEVGMQNAGLGATLAASAFAAQAAIPPALYMFGCMLTGTILARMWASAGSGTGVSPVTDRRNADSTP